MLFLDTVASYKTHGWHFMRIIIYECKQIKYDGMSSPCTKIGARTVRFSYKVINQSKFMEHVFLWFMFHRQYQSIHLDINKWASFFQIIRI